LIGWAPAGSALRAIFLHFGGRVSCAVQSILLFVGRWQWFGFVVVRELGKVLGCNFFEFVVYFVGVSLMFLDFF
jgi:hypothetical protein